MHHHFQKTPRQPLRASYHADSARALTLDSKVLGRITALPIRTCRIVPGVGRHELDRVPSAPGMELTERGWLDRSHRSDPAPFWLLGAWESHVVYVGAKGDLHLTSTPRANMYRFLIQLSLSQVHSRGLGVTAHHLSGKRIGNVNVIPGRLAHCLPSASHIHPLLRWGGGARLRKWVVSATFAIFSSFATGQLGQHAATPVTLFTAYSHRLTTPLASYDDEWSKLPFLCIYTGVLGARAWAGCPKV